MASLKRLDHLDVATADLADAASVYERNFAFTVARQSDGTATIRIGESQIRLVSGHAAAEALAKTGEGMFGLWLEAEDVNEVASALQRARVRFELRTEPGRRILVVDPAGANQVPLFIFDQQT